MEYTQYKRGIRLDGLLSHSADPDNIPLRDNVTNFSEASKKRLSWIYMQYDWLSMLTFTYHKDFPSWEHTKDHLDTLLESIRYRKIKYLWVLEFQRRGFPHFHVWLDRRFKDIEEWKDDYDIKTSWRPIMKNWLKITGQSEDPECSAFSLHQKTYTDWNIFYHTNYAAKYAEKNQQKGLPTGTNFFGRWWGSSRNLKIETDGFRISEKEAIENPLLKRRWIIFRRQVLKCLYKWHKYKLPSQIEKWMPVKYTLSESQVNKINQMMHYYLCEEIETCPY